VYDILPAEESKDQKIILSILGLVYIYGIKASISVHNVNY